jgi:hypothetical protein
MTAGEVRGFAKRAKDVVQTRRLLAIAAVFEGASREGLYRLPRIAEAKPQSAIHLSTSSSSL